MLPIFIRTTISPPAPSKRAHQRWARDAHGRMGEVWQAEILAARFRPGARYPHKPRSAAYLKRKARAGASGQARFGGQVINVFSGAMMDKLAQPGAVRAFPTRVTIQKTGTRYIDMRVYKSNQPDKWKELSQLLPAEARRLSAAFLMRYEQNREADRTRIDHQAK